MQLLPGGDMLAVMLPEKATFPGKFSLAASNGPSLCVVSGTKSAVDELEGKLSHCGVSAFHTSHAFHSQMMEPILGQFTEQVKNKPSAPKIPYVSNVTGTWITAKEATDPS